MKTDLRSLLLVKNLTYCDFIRLISNIDNSLYFRNKFVDMARILDLNRNSPIWAYIHTSSTA